MKLIQSVTKIYQMQSKRKRFRVYFIENKFNWNSVVLLRLTIVILELGLVN